MRTITKSYQPDQIRTDFLLWPKTLGTRRFSGDLETRWLEWASWVEHWTAYRWPGQSHNSYAWKATRWATDEEVAKGEA